MKKPNLIIENLKAILEECTASEDAVSYVNSEDAGTLKAAIEALEKQEAKKPNMIWDTTFGKIRPHCPVCMASNPIGANYCWNCGQRFIAEEEA